MARVGRRRLEGLVAALGATLVLLAPGGALAAEKEVNGFVGGRPGPAGGQFHEPTDVTVLHRSGTRDAKIFVSEGHPGNNRVQRLDADGNFELAWGRDVVRAGAAGDTGTGYEICRRPAACKAGRVGGRDGELSSPSGLAVDRPTGSVYVVDGGNGRVQQFTVGGRFVRAWSLDVPGSRGRFDHAPIAVAPSPPRHVFVGDGAANRILQFDPKGDFLRGWGWGVNTGTRELEQCTFDVDCAAAYRPPGLRRRSRAWPRHLAVDADGVIYSSPFLGVIFERNQRRAKIFRFKSRPAPSDAYASVEFALMDPLDTDGGIWGEDGTPYLTDGATLGLDVDPATGRLLVINNPFGPSRLDEVNDPGGSGRRSKPTVDVVDKLPFLQNVTGIAAADDGLVLLSSGKIRQLTGTSGFTGCASDRARRDCHGLVAIAAGGAPRAVLTPGVDGQTALVDPGGIATYRFEVSRDGRRWRSIGQRRYVAGSGPEQVSAPLDDLAESGIYKLRIVVTKKTDSGIESAVASGGVMLTRAG